MDVSTVAMRSGYCIRMTMRGHGAVRWKQFLGHDVLAVGGVRAVIVRCVRRGAQAVEGDGDGEARDYSRANGDAES